MQVGVLLAVRCQIVNESGVQRCVDLKARVALKTDRSVFKARNKEQYAKTGIQKLLLDHQAKSKTQEAKCQQQNVSDDWILTIT